MKYCSHNARLVTYVTYDCADRQTSIDVMHCLMCKLLKGLTLKDDCTTAIAIKAGPKMLHSTRHRSHHNVTTISSRRASCRRCLTCSIYVMNCIEAYACACVHWRLCFNVCLCQRPTVVRYTLYVRAVRSFHESPSKITSSQACRRIQYYFRGACDASVFLNQCWAPLPCFPRRQHLRS